jgi:hypothetical protein
MNKIRQVTYGSNVTEQLLRPMSRILAAASEASALISPYLERVLDRHRRTQDHVAYEQLTAARESVPKMNVLGRTLVCLVLISWVGQGSKAEDEQKGERFIYTLFCDRMVRGRLIIVWTY